MKFSPIATSTPIKGEVPTSSNLMDVITPPSTPPKGIPSLQQDEREECEKCPIRSYYLMRTPLEEEEIEDTRMYEFLYDIHTYPSSQPRWEEAYFNIMKETIIRHMLQMNISPPRISPCKKKKSHSCK